MFLSLDNLHIFVALCLTSLLAWICIVALKRESTLFPHKESRNYHIRKSLFYTLLSGSFLAMLASFFGPAWTSENTEATSGSDIIFTVDVSRSMDTADITDGSNKMTRLEMIKHIITHEISDHPENHYGAVAFAGQALIISPLTNDAATFSNLISNLNTNLIHEGGTNLTDAIKLSLKRFSGSAKTTSPKSVVILTDGEDIDNSIKMDEIKTEIRETKNVSLHIVGVGTETGGPIVMGQDLFGNPIYKNYEGQTVISKLGKNTISSLANIFGTPGLYVDSSDQDGILDTISFTTSNKTYLTKNISATDKSQYFMALSCMLYFGSLVIIRKK